MVCHTKGTTRIVPCDNLRDTLMLKVLECLSVVLYLTNTLLTNHHTQI